MSTPAAALAPPLLVFRPDTPMPSDSPGPNPWTTLTTGDLNNDGHMDIVAAHWGRTVGVFLANGDGTFAEEKLLSESWWNVGSNIGATSVALGDLDGDGILDMAIPIYGPHFSGTMVQLYRGKGDGSFKLWPVDGFDAVSGRQGNDGVNDGVILASGAANPMAALIADFDGDGRNDVAVSGNNGRWSVDVLTQNADKTFTVADVTAAGQNPQYMAMADFNEDGFIDVVAGALYNGVLVFLNDADGAGTLRRHGGTYLSPGNQYVIKADIDGDGHQDIVARSYASDNISVLYGDGAGAFPRIRRFDVSGGIGYLAAADLDNDGDTDLVVASGSTSAIDVLYNDGAGGFAAPETITLNAKPWGVALADFNNDGFIDIAASRDDDSVQILWNETSVTVTPASFHLNENSPAGSALGTIVATGRAPLVWTITAGNADVDGDGAAAFAINAATGAIRVADRGDLDHERAPRFGLTVAATDSRGAQGAAAVTILIDDVDEPGNDAPALADTSFSVQENRAAGGLVGWVKATDVDPLDIFTYAIEGGNPDVDGDGTAAVAIDAATGRISVADAGDLDFETTPVFNLTVRVTDSGGLSDAANVKVALSDMTERNGTPLNDRMTGSAGDDLLQALAGDDTLVASMGDDTLSGGAGTDWLVAQRDADLTLTDRLLTGFGLTRLSGIERAILTGGASANRLDASGFTGARVVLEGGLGRDALIGRAGRDDVVRAAGNVDFVLTNNWLTGLGDDSLTDIDEARLIGGNGANTIDASRFGGDLVVFEGLDGDDTLIGRRAGLDLVRARGDVNFVLTDTSLTGLGTDALVDIDRAQLVGGEGDNLVDAAGFSRGSVNLSGGGGDDILLGGVAGDKIYGGLGDDLLRGGSGADMLWGGAGADVFEFTALSDSGVTPFTQDRIMDFSSVDGDRIDLSGLDADLSTPGDQGFASFAEGGSFSGAFASSRALYFDRTAGTLFGNVDADAAADFSIQLVGVSSLGPFML